MKNNNDNQYEIRKARATKLYRATTDVLVNPRVVEQNASKLSIRPIRRRRRNYEKKIQNDPFIFSV